MVRVSLHSLVIVDRWGRLCESMELRCYFTPVIPLGSISHYPHGTITLSEVGRIRYETGEEGAPFFTDVAEISFLEHAAYFIHSFGLVFVPLELKKPSGCFTFDGICFPTRSCLPTALGTQLTILLAAFNDQTLQAHLSLASRVEVSHASQLADASSQRCQLAKLTSATLHSSSSPLHLLRRVAPAR